MSRLSLGKIIQKSVILNQYRLNGRLLNAIYVLYIYIYLEYRLSFSAKNNVNVRYQINY